jgi:hypothetical protein
VEYFLESIHLSIRPYELLHVFNNSRTAEQIFANVDFGEICKKNIEPFFFNRTILTTTSHEGLTLQTYVWGVSPYLFIGQENVVNKQRTGKPNIRFISL